MRSFLRVSLVLVPLVVAPCVAQAGVTLWRDKNHRGESLRVDRAAPDLRRVGLDDSVSSLQADEPWLVCSEPRFRGECRVVEGNVENLHGSGMNDRISSLRPEARGKATGREYPGPGRGRGRAYRGDRDDDDRSPERSVIRVYVHEGYRGRSETFDRAVPDLTPLGLAGQITSVQVDRGEWEICTRPNYGGRCTVIRSTDDLGDWSDAVFSLRPARDEDRDDRPWYEGDRDDRHRYDASIRVYVDEKYRGRSETFDRPVPDLTPLGLAGQITSVRVDRGEWEICTRPNYGGKCAVIRANDDNLHGWSDVIVSLRPAGSSSRRD